MLRRFLPLLVFSLLASTAWAADLPLVFEDDFSKGAGRWLPTDRNAWRIVEDGNQGPVYNQFQLSKYEPRHRSPHNIAIIKDLTVGDFVLTAKVKSTNTTAGAHRDMCVFFNYEDPTHFYYVHLGAKPDPNSSQIFIVNDAPRTKITENESPGVAWTDGWHQVKVVRKTADGLIEVYFDNMEKPILTAHDKTFTGGHIGLGSFDDHGSWDDVKLYGVNQEPEVKSQGTEEKTQ